MLAVADDFRKRKIGQWEGGRGYIAMLAVADDREEEDRSVGGKKGGRCYIAMLAVADDFRKTKIGQWEVGREGLYHHGRSYIAMVVFVNARTNI